MPSAIRVPLPPAVAVDPHFKIDIRHPTNGAIGLRVSEVASMESMEGMYGRRGGNQFWYQNVLLSPEMWTEFLHRRLNGVSCNIEGLDAVWADRTLQDDPRFYSQALHAFMPASPKYEEMESSVTRRTMYHSLHDVIACQHQRASEFEARSTRPGIDGEIWRFWKAACPNMNYLDALYCQHPPVPGVWPLGVFPGGRDPIELQLLIPLFRRRKSWIPSS